MPWIPKYIQQVVAATPRQVVTADRWNELWTLSIEQGDYTAAAVNDLINTGAQVTAGLTTHQASADHDGRYYTKTQADSTNAAQNATTATLRSDFETHRTSSDHTPYNDNRYYTRSLLDGGALDGRYPTRSEIDSGTNIGIMEEVFTLLVPDNGDGTFTYQNSAAEQRTGIIAPSGKLIYTLEQGDYLPGANRVTALINDTLHRSEASGGLEEISAVEVAISPENAGSEITIRYYTVTGAMSSGIVVGPTAPVSTYYGKFWLEV